MPRFSFPSVSRYYLGIDATADFTAKYLYTYNIKSYYVRQTQYVHRTSQMFWHYYIVCIDIITIKCIGSYFVLSCLYVCRSNGRTHLRVWSVIINYIGGFVFDDILLLIRCEDLARCSLVNYYLFAADGVRSVQKSLRGEILLIFINKCTPRNLDRKENHRRVM